MTHEHIEDVDAIEAPAHGVEVDVPQTEEEILAQLTRPKHYIDVATGIECSDITDFMAFNPGNSLKYLWRAGFKKGGDNTEEADLNKALVYLDRAFMRDQEVQLPADIMHKVYKVAAGRENPLIARAIVATCSGDFKIAYACITNYLKQ